MGRNNKQRRAARAKQRARRRPQSAATSGGWSVFDGDDDPAELARRQLLAAVGRAARGAAVASCVEPLLRMPAGRLEQIAGQVTAEVVDGLFQGGWTPVDLLELGRRRLDRDGLAYLVDALALTASRYPSARLDARWAAQLGDVGAVVWWGRDRSHLAQWSARRGRARGEALATLLAVLGLLGRLPRLDATLPPPGSAPGSAGPDGVDGKILARVRALLAKAESSEFPDEAEALSAKAQQLMSRYSLHRAMVEHAHGQAQRVAPKRIWLDAPYVGAKSLLVTAVASANRCRTVLTESFGFITVIGDSVDLRVVELLTTSLLVQATRAMVAAGSQTTRAGVSRTRSFRQSFLVAYATRIGERLRAATDEAQSGDSRLLPVLAARRRAVDDTVRELYPNLVDREVSVSNYAGWGAGRAAADLALFDVHDALVAERRAG